MRRRRHPKRAGAGRNRVASDHSSERTTSDFPRRVRLKSGRRLTAAECHEKADARRLRQQEERVERALQYKADIGRADEL